jgi:vacuolar-type H+-ATPase subunit H
MDENEALEQQEDEVATPIFNVYRRGYDPEQVDRYVNDQQRRLDEATHRASESERKLAAAVGQLRELHRRVAVYESEQRGSQPPALDTLGERVQRILQEAWEGAYNLRQEAEREVTEAREAASREIEAEREQCRRDIEELRQVASTEAAELVDEATKRALALRDEMDRRRHSYLERVERDRQRAVSQISFLYDQRQLALSELMRLQATIETTVEEMVRSPLGKPAAAIADEVAIRAQALIEPPVVSTAPPAPFFDLRADEAIADDPAVGDDPAFGEVAAGEMVADEMVTEMGVDLLAPPVDRLVEPPLEPLFEPEVALPTGLAGGDETGEFDVNAEFGAPADAAASWVPSLEAEIPTGPMEAIDYGYVEAPGYVEPAAYAEAPGYVEPGSYVEPADVAEAPTSPWVPGEAEPRPGHLSHGVFDGEVEGWQ